jgi:hypothetical protein
MWRLKLFCSSVEYQFIFYDNVFFLWSQLNYNQYITLTYSTAGSMEFNPLSDQIWVAGLLGRGMLITPYKLPSTNQNAMRNIVQAEREERRMPVLSVMPVFFRVFFSVVGSYVPNLVYCPPLAGREANVL